MSQADPSSKAATAGPAPYKLKPEHVTNRFVGFLAEMRAAPSCPGRRRRCRAAAPTSDPTSWPSLPPEDAAPWRAELDAGATRLDAADVARAA